MPAATHFVSGAQEYLGVRRQAACLASVLNQGHIRRLETLQQLACRLVSLPLYQTASAGKSQPQPLSVLPAEACVPCRPLATQLRKGAASLLAMYY